MNKNMIIKSFFALLGVMSMQECDAHKMACININSAGNSATTKGALVTACDYPLANITCDYADFAYTTAEGYRCFVKFDPTKITTSKQLNPSSFAVGAGTNEQNCGFINFNSDSGLNFTEINKSIQTTSVARKAIADLVSALGSSAPIQINTPADLDAATRAAAVPGSNVAIKIEYCLLRPEKKAVNDAMTFLGHTTVQASPALTVAQQKQQAELETQRKAATLAQANAQAAQQKAAALAQATASAQAAKAKAPVAQTIKK